MKIFKDTPLAKAILQLLEQLDEQLSKRICDAETGGCKVYIFGGCAIHLLTNSRGSNDLDVEVEAAQRLSLSEVVIDLNDVYFDDPKEGQSLLVLDENFNIGLSPVVSPDYKNRAWLLESFGGSLDVYVLAPIDLAISKLVRCAADDVQDILSLFSCGHLTLEEFQNKAEEASCFYTNPEKLRSNIEHVILSVKQSMPHLSIHESSNE